MSLSLARRSINSSNDTVCSREIFEQHLRTQRVQADHMLAVLLLAQWVFAIGCALFVSPRTWFGAESDIHIHVWSAALIGGLLSIFPSYLAWRFPGDRLTRMVMSSAQILYSALLIHLMGGRIEAHFHVFGSLAFLAFYKDRWVFVPAVLIVTADHLLRGTFWPQSVFGVLTPAPFRAFEHAGWVLFETMFLLWGVEQNLISLRELSQLHASLRTDRDLLEQRVEERTHEIDRQRRIQETILQNIPVAVFWKDNEGQFIGCNEMFSSFVGLETPQEIIGMRTENLPAYERLSQKKAGVLHWSKSDLPLPLMYHQERLRDSSGRERFVLSGMTALRDDQDEIFGTLGTFNDITPLKDAQSHATSLAEVIRQSPNEVYIFDFDSLRFIEANKGACENLGYDRSELLRMTPVDIKPEMTEAQLRKTLGEAVDKDSRTCTFETVHKRKDQTLYPVQVDVHESVFDGRRVFVAFVSDLTHRQELEQQLSQSQKLEAIGQLAAGVAHEINTPMQCVSGNVEFMKAGYRRIFEYIKGVNELLEKRDLDPESRIGEAAKLEKKLRFDVLRRQTPDAIEEAAVAVQRVIEIVRAMKFMSHPGKKERSEVDLNELIQNATVMTRNRWKIVAELELDLDAELPLLEAFPAELSQVFVNTIVNAADAISEKIASGASQLGRIGISTRTVNDEIEITITDTGAGMSEEVRARVFDQFFTTKDVGKGTGLGLAITWDTIARKHGGTIAVESSPGEGSTFIISLPTTFPVDDGEDLESKSRSNIPPLSAGDGFTETVVNCP